LQRHQEQLDDAIIADGSLSISQPEHPRTQTQMHQGMFSPQIIQRLRYLAQQAQQPLSA
jgi:hypothetical protein